MTKILIDREVLERALEFVRQGWQIRGLTEGGLAMRATAEQRICVALSAPQAVPRAHDDHPLRHFDRTCQGCADENF